MVLFSTSWLSLSWFEVVRYGRIFQVFWFCTCLSRIYCFTWAIQFFGTFNSPRATLHHARLSDSSTTHASRPFSTVWTDTVTYLRPFDSLAPRHLKTYFKLVAAIWIYAFITSVPFIYSVRTDTEAICSKEMNGTETCKEYSFCDLPSDWKTQLSKTIYFCWRLLFH